MVVEWFDATLVIILLACAWLALTTPNLLRAVMLFIAFGLLVALAWVRLQAPDVALAEAAVGSGLTGALLLSTLSAMQRAAQKRRLQVEAAPKSTKEGSNAN